MVGNCTSQCNCWVKNIQHFALTLFFLYWKLNFRLENFHKLFEANIQPWRKFYESANPQNEQMPEPYENIGGLLKLIILKCIRSDRIVPAVQVFL